MRREATSIRERNQPIVARIKEIKSEHPFWGYRRMWAYLKYVDGLEINKKRVLRLMQRNDLLVKPDTKLKAVRTPGRGKPRPECPIQWWENRYDQGDGARFWLDVCHGGTGLVNQEGS